MDRISTIEEIEEGNPTCNDFGDTDLFVRDQRGFSVILSAMIEDLNKYIKDNGKKSGIHLGYKVIDADYESNQLKTIEKKSGQ